MDSTQFNNIIYLKNYENPLFIGVSRDLYIKSAQRFFHHKDRPFSWFDQGNDLPFLLSSELFYQKAENYPREP